MRDGDIHRVIALLRQEQRRWKQPAVTRVARGRDPFKVLVSCLISLRTKDQVTGEASARLFSLADNPVDMADLPELRIQRAIYPAGFYRVKARNIREASRILVERHGGRVPEDLDALLELPGVGRKTANLVVTVAYRRPGICVDTHVQRVLNRLGYVATPDPARTESALREKLPHRYWIQINDLLVTYGQHVCTPVSPFCSSCRLAGFCDRRGVGSSR
jgi:endonuclease-3